MLFGWLDNARWYADEVFVIRTAPGLPELNRIHPDAVVICQTQYVVRDMDDDAAAVSRLWSVRRYCERNNVPVMTV